MEDLFTLLILIGVGGFFYFRKKDKKKRNISIGIALISFILFGITSPDVNSYEDGNDQAKSENLEAEKKEQEEKEKKEREEKEKKEQEEKEKKEQEEKEKKEQEEKETYNKEVTYEDLARNPDDYIFENVTFEGKILQVMQDVDMSQYRIAINDNYDDVMFLEIDSDQLESRILEDDYIRFYGMYMGEITYESTLGGNITIPGVVVDKFEMK